MGVAGKKRPAGPPPDLNREDRVVGALLGHAVGDALGGPLEFLSPEQIRIKHGTVREMIAGGWLSLRVGQGTDETELLRILGESLAERRGFDPRAVADAYYAWYRKGPIDVPNSMRTTMIQREFGEPWDRAAVAAAEQSDAEWDDNAPLARNLVLAVVYGRDPVELCRVVQAETALTHADPRAAVVASAGNLFLAALLDARPPAEALEWTRRVLGEGEGDLYDPLPDFAYLESEDLVCAKNGLDTLTVAVWSLLHAQEFESCLVDVVNRGGDTDTAAAVTGAFAGAWFGPRAIPPRWLNRLRERGPMMALARKLNRLVREGVEAPEEESEPAAEDGVEPEEEAVRDHSTGAEEGTEPVSPDPPAPEEGPEARSGEGEVLIV